MPRPPRDGFDRTLSFLRDPYRYIGRRSRELGSDVFETRLMLVPTLCLTGSEAARLFDDRDRFERLDGDAAFTPFVGGGRIDALVALFRSHLEYAATRWSECASIVLYEALQPVLLRAVCSWAGVPLPSHGIDRHRRDVVTLFESAGAIGPRRALGVGARHRAEAWLAQLVDDVRTRRFKPRPDSPLAIVAEARDEGFRLLPTRIAAAGLLDLIAPAVGAAVGITFAVHALQHRPAWRTRIATDATQRTAFVEEVRRFYPFCPAVAARVRTSFEWHGVTFTRGRRAMLDVFGTHHDRRDWVAPGAFQPERFFEDDALHIAPRCPGEKIAIELTEAALAFFAARLAFELPAQDLAIAMNRVPGLPKSGLVLAKLRFVEHARAGAMLGAAG